MKYLVTLRGRTWEVGIQGTGVTLNGEEHQVELRRVQGTPQWLLLVDGRSWSLPMAEKAPGLWQVLVQGEPTEVEVVDERTAHIRSLVGETAAPAGPQVLKAPMPGMVVRVLATPGQKVVEGTSLIVLEAMKMENELKASAPGVVEEVVIRPGDTVERGQILLRFSPPL